MNKILVIDSNADLLWNLKNILTKNQYEVSIATTAKDGIDIFYLYKPDLLILDINMDRRGGFEVYKKIREKEVYNNIPVILFATILDAVDNIIENKGDHILKKTFEFSKILLLITKAFC